MEFVRSSGDSVSVKQTLLAGRVIDVQLVSLASPSASVSA